MTKIIILAAGKGTRMQSNLPKVLVELQGKAIVKYLLKSVMGSKVDPKPIILVSPDNQDIIKKELKEYNLEYAIQEKALGTGHAVECALSSVGPEVKNLIILYGDHPFLKKETIIRLSEVETDSMVIMPTTMPDFDSWRANTYYWGRIITNKSGSIERIVEFKDASEKEKEIKTVNPGFMAFNRKWLEKNIKLLKNNNEAQEFYLTDMVKIAFDNNDKIGTLDLDPRESIGINNPEELDKAELLLEVS